MAVNVWANAKDVPGIVCADARLTDRSSIHWPLTQRPTTTVDQEYGQAGWQIGVNFLHLGDLAGKLRTLTRPDFVPGGRRRIRPGEIQRLAIHTHGTSGTIFINGRDDPVTLTAQSVLTHHSFLNQIGLMTADHPANPAVILLVGCSAGGGQAGTDLLMALSQVWPRRKVVAFATLGYAPGSEMSRTGEPCTEPGMRDTTAIYPGEADQNAGRFWQNLTEWPWAAESSPRAKVVMNRTIIRGGQW